MRLPDELRAPIRATSLRIRLQRAFDAGALLTFAGLGLAAVTVTAVKTGALADDRATPWLLAAIALPLAGALIGALRPIKALLAAKLLDQSHGLRDRVSNAVEFSAEDARTAFMDAAIEDAKQHASELSAKRAMPLSVPRDLAPAAALAALLGGLFVLEVPRYETIHAAGPGIDAVQLHDDDLDAYRSELSDLLDNPETPDDVRSVAREFNRLIEDLADERLERAESLRRLDELERHLADTRPADAELLRESLEELGEDMRRSDVADDLSEALREADAGRAEAEMRQLAERLRTDPPTRAELDALRRAIERAANDQPEDRSDEIREREEEEQRLLQRERENQATPQERRLLQRRQRELERLRRENQEAMERRRQLERLQREMSRAAEALEQNEPQRAGDDLDRAAEDLNRMAQQQLSEQEMQQLQQQLEALRELIRRQRQQQQGQGQDQQQQQQGGQGQSRMDRFVLRARGQGDGESRQIRIVAPGQNGDGQGQGQQQGQGQGQQGQGQQGEGQGQQGQGQGQGQGQAGSGQQGQGQGQDQGEGEQVLTLGGDGESNAILEIPGMGQGQQGQGQGGGQAQLGPGAGTGHDPTMLDDPTRLGGNRRNVRVEGQQGQGPSRSEVIRGSAQRGFANREYEDVYTDYSSHAEEVLERDEVPPGYRFYVRRYFQLIRPRE